MMFPIGVQLYSLRDLIQPGYEREDFLQILKWVAAVGYKGVQPAGFHGYTPAELKKIVEDLGMTFCSSHSPRIGRAEDIAPAMADAAELGIREIYGGFDPDSYKDMDAIKRTADFVNGTCDELEKNGFVFFLHNHYWEFDRVDGRIGHEIIAELCPKVKFEIDAYWSANFGANDPAAMVRNFRDRCILLHMKDGTLRRNINMLPLGAGKMDIPAIVGATDPNVNQWIIVELDTCAIDMMNGIKESYRYLVNQKLGFGTK